VQIEKHPGCFDEKLAAVLEGLNRDESLYWPFRNDLVYAAENKEQTIKAFIGILENPKSSNKTRRFSAFCLGEMRATKAVDALAAQITLELPGFGPPQGSLSEIEAEWNMLPSVEALVAIGSPSIPAMIRNLAESDDATVRKLSAHVLCRIDMDKDVAKLRLQKASENETDPRKKARLQSAVSDIPKISMDRHWHVNF
jgi:HEAT repeat protein